MEGISIVTLMNDLKAEVKAIKIEQQAMRQELTRYKGFVGGVLFVISAIGAAVGILITFIKTGGL